MTKFIQSNNHKDEKNYLGEKVVIETSDGNIFTIKAYILHLYSTTFNGHDAYMGIPRITQPDPRTFQKVYSSKLKTLWKVISGPNDSPIAGPLRGDFSKGNPPAWMFGLKIIGSPGSQVEISHKTQNN